MRGIVRDLRAAQRALRIPTGKPCLFCLGETPRDDDDDFCWRCWREFSAPLNKVDAFVRLCLDPEDRPLHTLSEWTGIPVRTLRRVTRGQRISRRSAERLAQIFGGEPEDYRGSRNPPRRTKENL